TVRVVESARCHVILEIAPQESFVDDLLNFDPTWFSY
ncbi:hypothetical protein F442_14934, partial [Phytophthora nicotianae P10297]